MKLSQNQIYSFIKTIQDNKEIISEICTPYAQTTVDMFKKGFSVVKEIIMVVGIALATLGAILLGVAAFPAVVVGAIVAALATVVILVKDNWQKIKDFF